MVLGISCFWVVGLPLVIHTALDHHFPCFVGDLFVIKFSLFLAVTRLEVSAILAYSAASIVGSPLAILVSQVLDFLHFLRSFSCLYFPHYLGASCYWCFCSCHCL